MKAVIKVRLKNGILDPQGKTVNNALHHLGFGSINDVRIGKLIELTIKEKKQDVARKKIEEACKKLLTNPIIEDFTYELIED
ncbi:MAG: phosphoribosylformylglycinamidine synthase [Caldithrix sp. RBG_13_44_9]|nr:MAG: phosphoribosylformylglycinamidine synthase [Caldithrix sp. RBG_13_44_9]